jgi:hypothetical protein
VAGLTATAHGSTLLAMINTPEWAGATKPFRHHICEHKDPRAEVEHLAGYATSDHLPILLICAPHQQLQNRGVHLFRYGCMWEAHDDFSDKLAKARVELNEQQQIGERAEAETGGCFDQLGRMGEGDLR